ncbi:MAG TPA: hypothetical protein VME66_14785 [Candidatus Acidoferrales bacterium]|nr:hypothetical protein [Candidatus Acidoferrales bacterium]
MLRLRLAIAALLLRLRRRALPIAAERVVLAALLGVTEDLVGLLDLLELLLGFFLLGRIRIRVPLARKLAIGGLDVFLGRILGDTEDLVIVFVVQPLPSFRFPFGDDHLSGP